MLGQYYLYFISVGTDYLSVKNGNVVVSSTPSPLRFTPSGWQEVSILTERNKAYWALVRSMTIPLEFIEDGAIIYTYLITKYGFNVIINQTIAERKVEYNFAATPTPTYKVWYDLLYNGEADLTTYENDYPRVSVNFVEGGPGKYLKKNERVTYEIPCNEKVLNYDGISLIGKQNFNFIDGLDYKGGVTDGDGGFWFAVGVALGNTEGNSVGLLLLPSQFQIFQELDTEHNWKDDLNYFAINNDPTNNIVANLKFDFGLKLKVRRRIHNFRLRVLVVSDTNFEFISIPKYTIFLNSNSVAGPYILENEGDETRVVLDVAIPLGPGERAFMFADFTTAGPERFSDFVFLPESKFSLNFVNTGAATKSAALTLITLFKRLVLALTGGKYTGESNLLQGLADSEEGNILVNSGQAIRQLPNPVVATNILDFYDFVNFRYCVGMGIVDNVVRIEPKEFWMDLTGPFIPLVNTGVPKFAPATDFMFNQLFVGYEPTDLEDVNGLNDFFNTQEYAIESPIQQAYSLISPYVASCYQQEFLRVNLEGRDTTDNPADKTVFVVSVVKGDNGEYNLNRILNAGATGLLPGTESSVFNIPLSPKRGFLANAWYIHSCFYKQDGDYLKFQTAEKNTKLIAGGIIEREDILMGNLPPQKFIPWKISVETEVSDLYSPLSLSSYAFVWKRANWAGMTLNSGIQPYTDKAQVFELLALASNNMEKLYQ